MIVIFFGDSMCISDDWLRLLLEMDVLFGYVNESFVATAIMAAAVVADGGTCIVIAFADEIFDAVRRINGGVSRVALLPMYVICGISDVRMVGDCFAAACE